MSNEVSPSNAIKEIMRVFTVKFLDSCTTLLDYTIQGLSGCGSNGTVVTVVGKDSREYAFKITNLLYYFIEVFDLDPIDFHRSAYYKLDEIANRIDRTNFTAKLIKGCIPSHFPNVSSKNSFYREYNALKALLQCENVVYLVDYGIVRLTSIESEKEKRIYELPYVIMPQVDGIDLTSLIERQMSECERLTFCFDIIEQIINIVENIHLKGVIHRDLYPNNFIVEKNSKVVLVDMGSALTNNSTLYETPGERRGARRFMSPEQFDNPCNVDERADFFFIGSVLFYTLTTITPFDRSRNYLTIPRKLSEFWSKPDEISIYTYKSIIEYADRLQAFEKSERYQTITEIRNSCLYIKTQIIEDLLQ